jgi:hypothetical protein
MKLPKEIKITKENSGGFMRPAEAVDYLNVSLFTIHHNLVSKQKVYAKRGNEYVLIEGYDMPLVDMANLPSHTNEKQNYDLYHFRKKQ